MVSSLLVVVTTIYYAFGTSIIDLEGLSHLQLVVYSTVIMPQNSALLITKLQSKPWLGVLGKKVYWLQVVDPETSVSSFGTLKMDSFRTLSKQILRYVPSNGTLMKEKSCHLMDSLITSYQYGNTLQ